MGNPFSRGGYVPLKGHSTVAAVRFLPNGALLTAGDTSMRLWNAENLKIDKVWKFSNVVETCCCSPDGRYIACGVLDGFIFVFEMRTRQQIAVWQAHAECGQGPLLQFFADSTYLLSAAAFSCKIWCARTSKLINAWDTTLLTSLSIAADCTLLAVGSNTGIVTIHNLPDGNATRRVNAHKSEVWVTLFSPDQSLLATASRDEPDGVKLWSTERWEMVQALRGHIGPAWDISFSTDGSQLVTCGMDKTLRVWSRRGGGASSANWKLDNVLAGHHDAVMACSFSPTSTGKEVVGSGARDGSARVWRLADVPKFNTADSPAYGMPIDY